VNKLQLGRSTCVAVALPIALVLAVASPASAAPIVEQTTRVSTATGGTQSDGVSYDPEISADGRYIAFQSNATNLVAGDTNGNSDIFLTDTTTGTTTRVSTATGGAQATGDSSSPAISADGRYITYYSNAADLVAGDTNGNPDIFRTDATTGTTIRVSTATGGVEANADSYTPDISADGRYIVYQSNATNLVGGDTNGASDIFLTDTTTGFTARISTATGGAEADDDSYDASISADGRYVTYDSAATDLVAGDTNGASDIFFTDTTTGTTTRISTATGGVQGDDYSSYPAITSNGRYVTYYSEATNLVASDTNGAGDVFLADTTTGTTTRVSTAPGGVQANGLSYNPAISGDGRYVVFYSAATNLVAGDTNSFQDIFVTDTSDGTTTRVNVATDGTQANASSVAAVISADGRFVSYYSAATNLVAGDTNAEFDVFLARLGAAAVVPAVLPPAGTEVTGPLVLAGLLLAAGLMATRARRTRRA